jgi:hypothetical protein
VLANTLVPVETSSKVTTGPLASGDLQVTLSHVECLPQDLALWHGQATCRPLRLALLELLFVAPAGRAQHPTQSSPEHRTSFLACFDGDHAIKPSRRWQPPRVTSTTGLQLEHLVPLDATSRCNRTRITHSQSIRTLASTSELEASQTKHTQGKHIPKVLSLSHGRTPHLFIATSG